MKKIIGLLAPALSVVIFIGLVQLFSKPETVNHNFSIMENLTIYFFSFVWSLGRLGWLLGGLLLVAYLFLF